MNMHYKSTELTPLRTAVLGVILAALFIAPMVTMAAPKEKEDKDNHGQSVAAQVAGPRIQERFQEFYDDRGWIPPGIARLLERWGLPIDVDDDDEDDTTDPMLEDVDEDVTDTTATLDFEFSEDVTVNLYVASTSGFDADDDGVMDFMHTTLDDEHEFMVEDLDADTEYFYFIEYEDEAGNMVTSDEMSFTTDMTDDDEDDTTAPVIESLTADAATTSATINVMFDEAAQVRLFVSDVDGFDGSTPDVMSWTHTDFDDEHEFIVEDLDDDTQYFYRLRYRDEAGNLAMSDQMSFTTNDDNADETAPELLTLTADAGVTTVTIDATFDEAAKVRLFVSDVDGFDGDTPDVMEWTHTDASTTHSFEIDGLDASTTYYYKVRFMDEAGNVDTSAQQSFMTDMVEDTTGPVISNVAGNAGTSTITGTFMTDEPATAKIYTSTVSGFELDADGVIVTEDTNLETDHELMITGLATSTTYYHIIVVEDEWGNTTESGEFTLGTL